MILLPKKSLTKGIGFSHKGYMIPFLQDSLKVCLLSVETDLQMKAQANLTKIYKFGSVEISQENNEKAQKQSRRCIFEDREL